MKDDYLPVHNDHHGLSLKKNQIVEVMEQLDTGRWFVQATSITGQIEHGWVPSSMLEPVVSSVEMTDLGNAKLREHCDVNTRDGESHQV